MILSNPFDENEFYKFVSEFLPGFTKDLRKINVGNSGFSEVLRVGEAQKLQTSVLIVRSSKRMASRISLTNNSFKVLKKSGIYRALIVYVNDDETIWRLSLLIAIPQFDSGKMIVKYSNPKRHSYVLGTDVGIATARKYLDGLGVVKDFEDLEYRFSVETVNKDFYKEIAEHFYSLVGKYSEDKKVLVEPKLVLPGKPSVEDLQNFSVRLLGRILFLWFLREKKSEGGNELLPSELLQTDNSKEIYSSKIEPIFFEVLNKPFGERESTFKEGLFKKVPYLNGGLFHPHEGSAGDFYNASSGKSNVRISDDWFNGLFSTLNTYNFTIDENLENDIDLSIDPEMLGRIFENLLAEINPETGQVARKSTGSYYTPRAIVNYMVDSALFKFLKTQTGIGSDELKSLISTDKLDDIEYPLTKDERIKVVSAITNLKCLDPACGSGAFPMGLLQKLLWVVTQADPEGEEFLDSQDFDGTEHWFSQSKLDFLRKRKIIRDVIFGVDIQSVAVEIAKLRCFLTLIVDQEIHDELPNRGVIPLPNLDFKFICADSLTPLEQDIQFSFGDDPDLEIKLEKIRKKFFTTTNEERKSRLKAGYEKLVNTGDSLFQESTRNLQLKTFRPFSANNQSNFFDPYMMFGLSSFDVVIGNPPYVSVKGISVENKSKYAKIFEVAKGRFNLFTLFIERGHNLLSVDGNLVFIIPDGIFSHTEYKHIRKYIVNHAQMVLAVLFSKRVFEAAVDTAIIQISNVRSHESVQVFRDIEQLTGTFEQGELTNSEDFIFPFQVDNEDKSLIQKIQSKGNLRLESEYEVQQGIIYSGQERSEVFSNMPLTNEFKPSLDGRDVTPFRINWDKKEENRFIKYTSKLHRAREERLFTAPLKLVMPRKSTKLVCSVDAEQNYALNTAYVVVPRNNDADVYFLAGLMNSKLMSYYYKNMYFGWQVTIPALKSLPICTQDASLVKEISRLSESMHKQALAADEPKDESLLNLDRLVYQLYGVTESEMEAIESTFLQPLK